MSFWGATVITNLLSPFPSLIEWLCGGHYVYNPTLKRFFLFHFLFPFLLCALIIIHLFYLHFLSSNNPLRNTINNKIPFFPYIISKDFYAFIIILSLYLLQTHLQFSSFSHPENWKGKVNRWQTTGRWRLTGWSFNTLSDLFLFLFH